MLAYESKTGSQQVDNLFKAILKLETVEDCYKFFEDICTEREIKSIAQRFEVARLLVARNTYAEIAEKTGASTATISRVNRALRHGAGGYQLVLEKLNSLKAE